jgi:hypothetical protein
VFGDEQILSGKALYQKLNQNLRLMNLFSLEEPPMPEAVASGPNTRFVYSSATSVLTVTGLGDGEEQPAFIYATPKLTPGTTYIKNRLRLIKATEELVADSDITSDYVSRFGQIESGDRIGIAIRFLNTKGQAGPLLTKFVEFTS